MFILFYFILLFYIYFIFFVIRCLFLFVLEVIFINFDSCLSMLHIDIICIDFMFFIVLYFGFMQSIQNNILYFIFYINIIFVIIFYLISIFFGYAFLVFSFIVYYKYIRY